MAEPVIDVHTIETDVLIVGSGPAGASLACFLAQNGVKGLVISSSSSTVKTPRAHYTNMAAMECLREIGLEDDAMRFGNPCIGFAKYHRMGETMTSGEFTRRFAFGNSPHKQGEIFDASPCEYLDLPQTKSEPLLLNYATQHGFQCRFDMRMLSFVDDVKASIVTTLLQDTITGQKLQVKSRFLAGADGAKSRVAEQLGLTFTEKPSQGLAMNVIVEADLSQMMAGSNPSNGLLHVQLLNHKERPEWGLFSIIRALKPWNEWLVNLYAAPWVTEIDATREEIQKRVEECFGDPSLEVKVKRISEWKVNEAYANQIMKGNVYCLGDAIHRHPPANGLGSNTCIQDAYNLAWKIAYVLQKKADPSLLATYGVERQPVAKQIVTRANDTIRLWYKYFDSFGFMEATAEERIAGFKELEADTAAGRARRKAFSAAYKAVAVETESLGAEMNQVYGDTSAVYLSEQDQQTGKPPFDQDYSFHYQQSTFPGFRLPHAWLGTKTMGQMVSTQDISGKCQFTLLTGIGGKTRWNAAAEKAVAALTGMSIKCFSIGPGQDYSDILGMWEAKREIEENGAVLVRPDRFIAWRCHTLDGVEDCDRMLLNVMKRILGLEKHLELGMEHRGVT